MTDDPNAEPPGDPRGWRDDPAHDGDPSGSLGWGSDPAPLGERPAGIGKRVGAYIIDYVAITIVLGLVLATVGMGSGLMPTTPESVTRTQAYVSSAISSALVLCYFVLLEAGSGQTIAKRMLRIKVVMADGAPATLPAAFKRRWMFFVGVLIPIVGGLINFAVPLAALITAIQDEPVHRGFHDRWADTKVIEV